MSVIHMDDFTGYGAGAFDTDAPAVDLMLAGLYAGFLAPGTITSYVTPGLVADPDGVSPGLVLQCGPSGQNQDLCVRWVHPDGVQTTIGVAMRVWFPQLPNAGSNAIIALMGEADADYVYMLCVTSTGRLQIRAGFYGSVLYSSAAPCITAQGWWHIEFKAKNTVSGILAVRVEGIPVPGLTLSGDFSASTDYAQVAQMQSGAGGGASHVFFVKDYVIWDGQGPDATDWVGTSLVFAHDIYADLQLNWTPVPGASEGFEILGNIPPNPTQYIYAEHDPEPDPYQGLLNALPPDITTVKAVLVRYMAGKNDGGDGFVQSGMIGGVNETPATANGEDRPITIAQTFYQDIFHRNPVTNTAWLPSNFDDGNVAVQLNRTA